VTYVTVDLNRDVFWGQSLAVWSVSRDNVDMKAAPSVRHNIH